MENFTHIYLSMTEAAMQPAIAPVITRLEAAPSPSRQSRIEYATLEPTAVEVEDDYDRRFSIYPTLYF